MELGTGNSHNWSSLSLHLFLVFAQPSFIPVCSFICKLTPFIQKMIFVCSYFQVSRCEVSTF